MSNPLKLPAAPAHIALIGPPSTGQSLVAEAIIAANPGRAFRVSDSEVQMFATARGSPGLYRQFTGLLDKLEASRPLYVVRDFSDRLQPVPSNDPWLILADEIAEAANVTILTVLHSGASGRDIPEIKFTETWTVKSGWPPDALGRPRSDSNGTEVHLFRPGRRAVLLRSDDGFRSYRIIEELTHA